MNTSSHCGTVQIDFHARLAFQVEVLSRRAVGGRVSLHPEHQSLQMGKKKQANSDVHFSIMAAIDLDNQDNLAALKNASLAKAQKHVLLSSARSYPERWSRREDILGCILVATGGGGKTVAKFDLISLRTDCYIL
jgi:hypothetical protein